jgi:N-acetyltransferase 10
MVSVKSSTKRKAAETARDIYEKEIGSKEKKRIKKGTEGRR